MKKIISLLAVFSMMFSSFAFSEPARAIDPPNWDVTGSYTINVNFLGTDYPETLILAQTGPAITGTSLELVGGGSPWTIDGGSVSGDTIYFEGFFNAGPTLRARFDGSISQNGTMSGTWQDIAGSSRTGTWMTTSGTADNDSDNDGVVNSIDKCATTVPDAEVVGSVENVINFKNGNSQYVGWGQNRWLWTAGGWMQKFSNPKKPTTYTIGNFNTYGCSAKQILTLLNQELGNVMNGHWKFGLSTSVLQDFSLDYSDGVLDGKYYLETVTVNSNNILGKDSITPLVSGKDYQFKVSGTWTNRPGEIVDAKFTTMDGWSTNTDAPAGGYPAQLLDLQVNQSFLDWGSYSSTHNYEMNYTPMGNGTVNFRVFDGDVNMNTQYPGWFGDNVGNLTVDIYAQI